MRLILAASLGFVLTLFCQPALAADPFPEPTSLASEVKFWEDIYVEVSSKQGLLHDSRHLSVVYETIGLHGIESRSKRQDVVEKRKRHWRGVLKRLGSGGAPRGDAQARLVAMIAAALGREPGSKDYREAAKRLRFQLGQSDRFKAGLIRSGAYESHIRDTLRAHGVPEDLAYLPHVESSFQAHAYSKSGAAGMWQFIPSTGRRFLTIDYVIDERLSPSAATLAAARLLSENFEKLGTWPLAITAYNHGAAGMRRAVKKVGTRDIATICRDYDGRYFGFASRNFYGQFLAARRIASNFEEYFGPLQMAVPTSVDTLMLPYFVDAVELSRHLGEKLQSLASLNPALRKSVWSADRWIPRGFELKLPPGTVSGDSKTWVASLPESLRHSDQRRSRYHTVSHGETLGHIAKLHGTTIASLIALNSIANPNRIFPGQKLEMN